MSDPKKDEVNDTLANWLIFGGAILFAGFIMFASAYQAWNKGPPQTETVVYNHFTFEHIEGLWYTHWQKDNTTIYSLATRYNPYQVENLSVLGELSDSFNRREMYVAFNPTKGNFSIMGLAASELSLSMARALNVKPIAACLINDTSVCEGRPVVSCPEPNATVIALINEGEPSVWLKGDCVELRGSQFGILQSVDRLLFSWYKVIQ